MSAGLENPTVAVLDRIAKALNADIVESFVSRILRGLPSRQRQMQAGMSGNGSNRVVEVTPSARGATGGLEIIRALHAKVEYHWPAMAEWLVLLLLVPVIVAPVVLLVGFAGCALPRHGLGEIAIGSAEGQDVITIRLTWHSTSDASELEFVRTKVIDGSEITFDAQPSPFDDTDGLEADNMYSYILRQRDDTDFKSSAVIGTTRGFETTFEETDTGPPPVDQGPLPAIGVAPGIGVTLVLQIKEVALRRISRTQIKQARITLFASDTMGDASIDAIFISRVSSEAGANPYDAADRTAVFDRNATMPPTPPLLVPAGVPVPLVVDYSTDVGQDLLIAVDFSAAPAVSAVTAWTPVPPERAVAWVRTGPPEAAVDRRSMGYGTNGGVPLIGKIEIG